MRVEWFPGAVSDLQRLRSFILPHNSDAAQRAVQVIRTTVAHLEVNPRIGKPVEGLADYHDLVIPFGSAGYLLRYRIQVDVVYIVAVKHCKEAGYAVVEPV